MLRKWRTLSQFQQTRGALAMFAQWDPVVFIGDHRKARPEPLITLGSAPLQERAFRSVVLGQLGEVRLEPAVNSDIAGEQNKAAALDADAKGALKEIHRRVGTAILFESSGGQSDQLAHEPELRFALAGPDIDTTSIDNAAKALEARAFYIRKAGTDGYRFGLKPKLEKVVNDRRASLDETDVRKGIERVVNGQFGAGATLNVQKPFPKDSADVEDLPQLNLVVVDPDEVWEGNGALRAWLAEWTWVRGARGGFIPRRSSGASARSDARPGRGASGQQNLPASGRGLTSSHRCKYHCLCRGATLTFAGGLPPGAFPLRRSADWRSRSCP